MESKISNSSFSKFNSSDRILIFAPSPDDESLGTGRIIQRAKEDNTRVIVVSITDGSGSKKMIMRTF